MMKRSLTIALLILGLNIVMAQDGNFVETNGLKIYYEEHGQGEALLLLHGFTGSHETWDLYIEELEKEYRLIIPDLRGHGRSTNPSNIFTHKLSAQDMLGLMDALNIDKFKAIGHSSGGMTLTHMATMDTTRIISMILIGATSFFPEECRAVQRQVYYETQEDWVNSMKKVHPGGEEQIRKLFAQFRNMAETYDDMNFTPPYLQSIKCETLIVHGDRDIFFPVDIPVLSYKSIPNSYLWIIPNDGHVPAGMSGSSKVWLNVFISVFKDFLAGNWKAK